MECIYCNDNVLLVGDYYVEMKTNKNESVFICEICYEEEGPFSKGLIIGNQIIEDIKYHDL